VKPFLSICARSEWEEGRERETNQEEEEPEKRKLRSADDDDETKDSGNDLNRCIA